jgi:hypothetical protein
MISADEGNQSIKNMQQILRQNCFGGILHPILSEKNEL